MQSPNEGRSNYASVPCSIGWTVNQNLLQFVTSGYGVRVEKIRGKRHFLKKSTNVEKKKVGAEAVAQPEKCSSSIWSSAVQFESCCREGGED